MDAQNLDLVTAVLVGIGLSAACGFRVFVPLLGASLAAHTGHLQLSPDFAWLGSTPALVALSLATALEIGAYSIPVIDHLMDVIASPVAVVAGTLLMASLLGDTSPFLKWSLAVIAGGGTAGLVQTGSVLARGGSALLSGGLSNLIIALLELAGAVAMTMLAIFVPLMAVVGLLIVMALMIRRLSRRGRERERRPTGAA